MFIDSAVFTNVLHTIKLDRSGLTSNDKRPTANRAYRQDDSRRKALTIGTSYSLGETNVHTSTLQFSSTVHTNIATIHNHDKQ